MYKCINCKYEGNEVKKPLDHCPICGDNTVKIDDPVSYIKEEVVEVPAPVFVEEEELYGDVNDDGKVDASDVISVIRNLGKKKSKPGRKGRK